MPKTKTSWQPGQSGNARGRPKTGKALSELLRQRLDGTADGEKLVDVLVKLALAGSLAAIELILNRLEGKPTATLWLAGDDVPRVVRMPLAGPPDETIGMTPPENDHEARQEAQAGPGEAERKGSA